VKEKEAKRETGNAVQNQDKPTKKGAGKPIKKPRIKKSKGNAKTLRTGLS